MTGRAIEPRTLAQKYYWPIGHDEWGRSPLCAVGVGDCENCHSEDCTCPCHDEEDE